MSHPLMHRRYWCWTCYFLGALSLLAMVALLMAAEWLTQVVRTWLM